MQVSQSLFDRLVFSLTNVHTRTHTRAHLLGKLPPNKAAPDSFSSINNVSCAFVGRAPGRKIFTRRFWPDTGFVDCTQSVLIGWVRSCRAGLLPAASARCSVLFVTCRHNRCFFTCEHKFIGLINLPCWVPAVKLTFSPPHHPHPLPYLLFHHHHSGTSKKKEKKGSGGFWKPHE